MNLEDDLRRALRREPAPPGFAAKVLAKARGQRILQRPVAFALAAALAVAALLPPAVYEYRRQQRGLEARDRLIAALAIAKVQLQQVNERVRRNTRHKI